MHGYRRSSNAGDKLTDGIAIRVCFGLISLLAAASAAAVPIAYASSTDFYTALTSVGLSASTLDFDAATAGTSIGSGDSLGGITFTYDF